MGGETDGAERRTGIAGLRSVARVFAEASLAAMAFALAILLIGLPFAILVKAVHAIVTGFAGN
jgi:hypothetical protein